MYKNLQNFQTIGSGKFEVSILAFYNQKGITEDGHCCAGSRDIPPCSMECETFFSICLLHFSTDVSDDHSCTYGRAVTPVLGGNVVNKTALAVLNYFPLSLPFQFAWPVSNDPSLFIIGMVWNKRDLTPFYHANNATIHQFFGACG